MIAFDEVVLNSELTQLPHVARVALAAAAASRQLHNYESICHLIGLTHADVPVQIVADLWNIVFIKKFDETDWKSKLDIVMSLYPAETEHWTLKHALAEDALSSLAYAIRCLLSGDSQEAAWALRCAYEASDQAAIRISDVGLSGANAEQIILSHQFVQRELQRQRRDVMLLLVGSSDETLRTIQNFSIDEELLSLAEIEVADRRVESK